MALVVVLAGAPPPRLHGFMPHIEGSSEVMIDAWTIGLDIDRNGEPSVEFLQRGPHYSGQIAPCASPADLRDVHSTEFPTQMRPGGQWTLADVVVTAMDNRGRAICARIFTVVVKGGHRSMQYPLLVTAHIPLSEAAAAIRISGWRGMPEKTYSLAELRRRFGR
ncbi:MAG TPA: hypothetical protein VG323_07290 [Thermoanaerobaculia bacterium]|nr:hypothetical protein [Thermoanaerobaculia bacterium]